MTFQNALAELTATHRGQIEADLESAWDRYKDAKTYLAAAERQLHMLQGLLTTGATAGASTERAIVPEPVNESKALTLHEAMRQVLKDSPKGEMRAGEIIAEIERRNLYRMRDGRIPESQQIHARAGHYPHMFGKHGSYFYAK